MTLVDSVSTCLKNYATFSGRASRSEYWWFVLFFAVVPVVLGFISQYLSAIVMLALIVPIFAVSCRRLHDVDRSGWFQLINLIPLGSFYILYLNVQAGTPAEAPNRF